MRVGKFSELLQRGVWVAPWMGPNGEFVLIAIDRHHRIVGDPVTVPAGANHVQMADELWERLDAADPMPMLKVI